MALFHSWNAHKFRTSLPVFRTELMQAAKIGNKTTYTRCLYELEAKGYLCYQPAASPYQPSLVFMHDFSAMPISQIPTSKVSQNKTGKGIENDTEKGIGSKSGHDSEKATEKDSEPPVEKGIDTKNVTGNDTKKSIEHEQDRSIMERVAKKQTESSQINHNFSSLCLPAPITFFKPASFCRFCSDPASISVTIPDTVPITAPYTFLNTLPGTFPKNGNDSEKGTGKVLVNKINTINFQTNNNIHKDSINQQKVVIDQQKDVDQQELISQKDNPEKEKNTTSIPKENPAYELKPASFLTELPEEKEKVAEKRKRSLEAIPFTQSVYADKDVFVNAFAGTEFEQANLLYYHAALANWRDKTTGEPPLRKDWLALARTFMLNDIKAGKLVLFNHPVTHVKPHHPSIQNNGIDLPALFRLIDERHP